MKFTAAGDILIQRRIQEDFAGYEELRPYIEKGDARFFNLETTLHYEGECFASQFSGGTYVRTNPEALDDIKKFGFNMTSFNNNHIMDFSYDGLEKTIEAVNKSGLVHSGVGHNLTEASSPRYLDTAKGRVALISVNTSFNPSMMAGEQARRVKGRPGINGLRHDSIIEVSKDEMEFMKNLAEKTGINNEINNEIRSGYAIAPPEGIFDFGSLRFKCSDETKLTTSVNKTDMARVEKAIYDAQLQADYILISVHTHQPGLTSMEQPPEFMSEFAHKCIDAGAHAVIGHGPHRLRPIEIYKNRPIFHSLGDFVLELYNVELAPEDFYSKYGLNSDYTMHDLLKTRSNNFTRGLMTERVMMTTVIPYWEMENGELTSLELLPVELAMTGNNSEIGLPRIAKNLDFMDNLAKISAPYGVDIKMKNGVAVCTPKV